MVFYDDIMGQMETHTGALTHLPGGEKGLEDVRQIPFFNARSVVGNDHHHLVFFSRSGADFNNALAADGLQGIAQDLEKSLVELPQIAAHLGNRLKVFNDLDMFADLAAEDIQGCLQALVDIGRLEGLHTGMGKIAQIFDDGLDPLGTFHGLGD